MVPIPPIPIFDEQVRAYHDMVNLQMERSMDWLRQKLQLQRELDMKQFERQREEYYALVDLELQHQIRALEKERQEQVAGFVSHINFQRNLLESHATSREAQHNLLKRNSLIHSEHARFESSVAVAKEGDRFKLFDFPSLLRPLDAQMPAWSLVQPLEQGVGIPRCVPYAFGLPNILDSVVLDGVPTSISDEKDDSVGRRNEEPTENISTPPTGSLISSLKATQPTNEDAEVYNGVLAGVAASIGLGTLFSRKNGDKSGSRKPAGFVNQGKGVVLEYLSSVRPSAESVDRPPPLDNVDLVAQQCAVLPHSPGVASMSTVSLVPKESWTPVGPAPGIVPRMLSAPNPIVTPSLHTSLESMRSPRLIPVKLHRPPSPRLILQQQPGTTIASPRPMLHRLTRQQSPPLRSRPHSNHPPLNHSVPPIPHTLPNGDTILPFNQSLPPQWPHNLMKSPLILARESRNSTNNPASDRVPSARAHRMGGQMRSGVVRNASPLVLSRECHSPRPVEPVRQMQLPRAGTQGRRLLPPNVWAPNNHNVVGGSACTASQRCSVVIPVGAIIYRYNSRRELVPK